jgi:Ca2+-transporting ATPase
MRGTTADLAERTPSRVRPVHTAVTGRARLHVRELQRNHAVKQRLERELRAKAGIRDVSASAVTSNVLVWFDPAMPLNRIIDCMIATLDDVRQRPAGAPQTTADEPTWHAHAAAIVARVLQTSETAGLPPAEVEARLTKHGRNALMVPPTRSGLSILAEQFHSLPVALLAVAAGLSVVTAGAPLEAAAILAVLGLNGAIGYITESRSERTIRSLAQAGQPSVRVIRGGRAGDVPIDSVVVGDLLQLQRGAIVAADARVVAARDLTVSEAVLTGESLPVDKTLQIVAAACPLGDRRNMVYRGTVVTGGSGTAVVVATGMATELGRIQQLIASATAPETPMQRQLGDLGRQMVWLSAAVCGGVFGIGVLRGVAVLQMFRSAVSLAVAALPEGLPTVATTTLAFGIEDMRRRGILVRRLDAVETLAAVQVICFDKTGTVTMNQMAVARMACGDSVFRVRDGGLSREDGGPVESAGPSPLARMLEIGVLCSETGIEDNGRGGRRLTGTATENALVQQALESEVDAAALRQRHPTLSVRQRTESYRFMATIHSMPDGDGVRGLLVGVKGSPLEVLERCWWELKANGERQPLTPGRRADIERANAGMAEDALRVLGFAYREIADATPADAAELPIADLTWVGLTGLADPVRPGMHELMGAFQRAGIRTVLVTGDQSVTARTVARELGLNPTGDVEIFDAAELERLPPDGLAAAARRAHVFARVSPGQKLLIVRALQRAEMVVAMTGDGVNDGPALKAAELGIALGRSGTEAAREVADVVLETDDLTVLIEAVERGRTTNVNIRKAIHYLLSTNLSEILVVLVATATGGGQALSPMQLLWINLISDVLPGLGLACDPPHRGAMERGPLPANEPILQREDFGRLALEAAMIAAGALAAGAFGALRHGNNSNEARTMCFVSLVLAQLLHALTCRKPMAGGFSDMPARLPPNPILSGALMLTLAVQAAGLLFPGIRRLLGVVPLGALDITATLAGGVLPYLLNEAARSGQAPGAAPRGLQITARSNAAAERSST